MDVRVLTLFDLDPIDNSSVNKKLQKQNINEQDKNSFSKTKQETVSQKSDLQPEQDKIYLSIGDVAKKFKVRTSHIRFWTLQFGLKVRTNKKGDRLYNKDNIEQLQQIYELVKVQGYTIAGAKARLRETKKKDVKPIEVEKKVSPPTQSIKSKLSALKALLTSIKQQIDLL